MLDAVCLDYSSTRGLSPSRCWLVLRQHRSSSRRNLRCLESVTYASMDQPHATASMLAPVFPGCHVICRPATYHGIEPPPSYRASTNEPESNRHFLCWWPEVIPASGMARGPTYPVAPEKIIVAAKSLFTCFRIATAHSPTRSTARDLPRGGRLPGTGCEPCFFLEPAAGVEPATSGLQVRRSTAELHRLGAGGRNRTDDKRLGRTLFYR